MSPREQSVVPGDIFDGPSGCMLPLVARRQGYCYAASTAEDGPQDNELPCPKCQRCRRRNPGRECLLPVSATGEAAARGVPAGQASMLTLVSRHPPRRPKALVAQLASGLSSNKEVAFFPLHMPSRKSPLCKMRPSTLGIRGGSVVFSTLHRLALVRLPQICVSLCCTFVTRHSRPPCTSTCVMSTNGYRGRYVPSQE